MNSRLGAVVLVVLLLGVATGTVLAVGSAQVIETNETANSLSPTNVSEEGYVEANIDVGTAVAADAEQLHARHDELTFEAQFAATADGVEARELIEEVVRDIEKNIRSIERQRAELYAAYQAGERGEATLIRGLSSLDAAADRQELRIDRLTTTIETSPNISLRSETQDRIDAIINNPAIRPSPVEQRLFAATEGTADPVTAYVQGNGDALVLAAVTGTTHLRQATILSERDGSGTDRIGTADSGWFDATNERVAALYPWAWANLAGGGGDVLAGLPFYFVEVQHPHGTLQLFFDGTSENVFREHQINNADVIPVTETTGNTTDGLVVTVQTTHVTGPMRVNVADADTDLPVAARISVDGQQIGLTGGNGQLRTVQPSGTFTVEVTTTDGEAATVTISGE
ncbi:MAG: hypothetical protein V5A55_05750 [Halovenus sp.]